MNTIFFLISIATAFLIVNWLIPVIILNAKDKNFLDVPDNRKEHKLPKPTLGGIAIYVAFIFTLIFNSGQFQKSTLIVLALATSTLFTTGLVDDLKGVSALKKLIIQIAVAALISSFGFGIKSFYGLFNIYELPVLPYYLFNIVLITGITNAYNLIDGVDGLAGGLGVINSIIFSFLFYINNNIPFCLLSAITAVSFLAFLRYNFSPSKIFMGDTGSLHLGLMMSVYGITLINSTGNSHIEKVNLVVVVASILALPVADTLRVFFFRALKGKKPFFPDRSHCHHLLIKNGYDHKETAIVIYLANLLMTSVGVLLIGTNGELSILIIFSVPFLMIELLTFKKLREKHIVATIHQRRVQALYYQNQLLKKEMKDFKI